VAVISVPLPISLFTGGTEIIFELRMWKEISKRLRAKSMLCFSWPPLHFFSPHNFTDSKHWNGVICCFLLDGTKITQHVKAMRVWYLILGPSNNNLIINPSETCDIYNNVRWCFVFEWLFHDPLNWMDLVTDLFNPFSYLKRKTFFFSAFPQKVRKGTKAKKHKDKSK